MPVSELAVDVETGARMPSQEWRLRNSSAVVVDAAYEIVNRLNQLAMLKRK